MDFDFGFWVPLISGVISANSGAISAVAAIAAIVVAVVVAFKQHEQGEQQLQLTERQERFEKQLTEREERRHLEKIDAAACSFLQGNSLERQLVPLCFSAAMYDKTRPYHRKIYRDFCCLPLEVQNRVFESEGLSFKIGPSTDEDYFARCVKALEELKRRAFPCDDGDVLYDNGKYLRRCLDYADRKVPIEQRGYRPERHNPTLDALLSAVERQHPYEEEMTDILSEAFRDGGHSCANPIEHLSSSYGFRELPDVNACKFVTILCTFLASYGGSDESFERGCACDFLACGECTMEDLFLYALNTTHVCLLRSDSMSGQH